MIYGNDSNIFLSKDRSITRDHEDCVLEVCKQDKELICKTMKLDWRERPSAKELLEDEWWTGMIKGVSSG
jgi:hypothetical protein